MPSSIDFLQETNQITTQLVEWRRDFHMHPELGFEERRSAEIIARCLESWGYAIREGIAETGVHARLPGKGDGPGILLRVDMDALPIHEQSEKDYASIHPGVMHACGHDGHMAIGLGVAKIIAANVDRMWGDVHLIFQPAEEGGGGAARMIDEGVLNNIDVETALGVHLWNEKPLGWFGISPGPIMAGAERFEIRVNGQGGHGGMPHLTRDPILASAAIISEAQTIVARNIDALKPAVLSFTHIKAGSSFNVIPAEVMMEGTIRTLAPATRTELIERFRTITEQIASAHACEASLSVEQVAPAVINDPDRTNIVAEVATDLFPHGALDSNYRLMVSEDMAFFLDKIPGVFILVGSANDTLGLTSSHHTASFDFDEQALNNAVALLCAVIWQKVKLDD